MATFHQAYNYKQLIIKTRIARKVLMLSVYRQYFHDIPGILRGSQSSSESLLLSYGT